MEELVKNNRQTTEKQKVDNILYYEVPNDALAPDFKLSDVLAIKRLERPYKIKNGKPYVIETSGGFALRNLYKSKENYIAKAFNLRYSDTYIEFNDMYNIFQVLGLIRKNI